MRAVIAVAACGTALGACVGPQLDPVRQAQMDAAMARNTAIHECRSKYPKRKRGQAAEAVRCMNNANSLYQPPEAADLIRLAGARSLELAERYDAGKITDTQLDLEIAALDAEFQTAVRSRMSQQMAVVAAQEQAAAAQRQAAMQGIMAGAAIMAGAYSRPPPPPPSLPRHTNCSTFGNRTNCTTW